MDLKKIFVDPNLSATAKAIFVILSGMALSPKDEKDVGSERLAKYMKEDIDEIERALKELEEYSG
ncbi:MAG: hypothetical protein WAN46_10335 [Gammaproteobacteria bacterium]